jgi:hypothetical protein
MVIIDPNLEYGDFGAQTFTNLVALFAPFIQFAYLFYDGFYK